MSGVWGKVAGLFARSRETDRAAVERVLLEADFGVSATDELLERVTGLPPERVEAALEMAIADLLSAGDGEPGALRRATVSPTVMLVVGVNGVGKTTTVAKLAHRLLREGRGVLLAAADTYRAGAAQQLRVWADRLGVPCVAAGEGAGRADPAAVAFDAVAAAEARGIDTVLIDTAGRLHTDGDLLDEVKKVGRVVAKRHAAGDAPHEALLVLDATVGQNAVPQARAFAAALPLTGLVVTKLDGTARGGSVVALRRAVAVPVRFVGTGEGLDDLAPFDSLRYAHRLVRG